MIFSADYQISQKAVRNTVHITEDETAVYRKTARRRWAQERQRLAERHEQAWMLARQAGALLRERFRVEQVVVFGSLVREELFHPQSDVDWGVWGLDEKRYYRAVAQLLTLDPTIEIDLVIVEDAPVSLRETVEREGVVV